MPAPAKPPASWWRNRNILLPVGVILVILATLMGMYLLDASAPPRSADALRQELTFALQEGLADWAQLDGLWSQLEAGGALPCDDPLPPLPYFVDWRQADRSAYPQYAALADQLNDAITRLHRAADTLNRACSSSAESITTQRAAAARTDLTDAQAGLAAVQAALANS